MYNTHAIEGHTYMRPIVLQGVITVKDDGQSMVLGGLPGLDSSAADQRPGVARRRASEAPPGGARA